MQDKHNTKKIGDTAESKACEYLQSNGLTLLEKNYFCSVGEIDLIMQDGEDIVFVEVRSRYHHINDAIESIDQYKQAKLIKAAAFYLKKKQWTDKVYCRFDVIGTTNTQIEWIKDAFATDNF